jgi:hypothetical protein
MMQTFFSTDIVKYQRENPALVIYNSSAGAAPSGPILLDMDQKGVSFSGLALDRFLQVSLSLMVLTFAVAGVWYVCERRYRKSQALKIKEKFEV